MACTTCKQKRNIKEEIVKSGEFVSKSAILVAVIWLLLGFYGLYSLIIKLI